MASEYHSHCLAGSQVGGESESVIHQHGDVAGQSMEVASVIVSIDFSGDE